MAKSLYSEETKFNWRNMPLLYIYIFQFIAEKAGKFDQEISSKIILEMWHRNIYHIPRIYDYFILEEMAYFGFIRKERTQRYFFYGSKIDKAVNRLVIGSYELNDEIEAPLLYLYVFSKMTELFGQKNQILTSRQLLSIWRTFIPNVPRIYDFHILTEMNNYGLIRRLNSQKYIFYGARGVGKLKRLNRLRFWD